MARPDICSPRLALNAAIIIQPVSQREQMENELPYSESRASRSVRTLAPVIACTGAFAVGNFAGWITPQVVAGTLSRFDLSAAKAGLAPTIEALAMGGVSFLLAGYVSKHPLRWPSITCFAIWAVTYFVSRSVQDFNLFLLTRLVAGIAGGYLIAVATSLAATTRRPDRTYAIMNMFSSLFGAAVVSTLPMISPNTGGLDYLAFAALASLVCLPALLLIPNIAPADSVDAQAPATGAPANANIAIYLLIVPGLLIFTLQSIINFAFSIGVGARIGLSEADVNVTLGLASLMGAVGALGAAFVTGARQRFAAILVVLGIAIISNFTEVETVSPALFRASLVVNMMTMFCLLPLFLGWSATLDHSGRYPSRLMGMYVLTASVAPVAGGWLVDTLTLNALGATTLVSGTTSIVLVVTAFLLQWRGRKASVTVSDAR